MHKAYLKFKILLYCIICSIHISWAVANPLLGGTQNQNLVLHLPMDGNSDDISGKKNNGIIKGEVTPTSDRLGNPCGALYFDGIDGFIEIPHSPSLSAINSVFTVTCWVRPSSDISGDNKVWLTLICKGKNNQETANNPHYRVQLMQSDVQRTISINTDFTELDQDFSSNPIGLDQWQFFALVYDGKEVMTYLDGEQIWKHPYSKTMNSNTAPLHIGKDIPGSTEYFSGDMDDLRIYSTPISAAGIRTIYNEKPASKKPAAHLSIICPKDINVQAPVGQCGATVIFQTPAATSDCGTPIIRQVAGASSGSFFPIGTDTILFQAIVPGRDTAYCEMNVRVTENQYPTIDCPADTIISVPPGTVTIRVEYPNVMAFDRCCTVIAKLSSGLQSGSQFPIGMNRVTYTTTDNSGNTVSCGFNIIIKVDPKLFSQDCPSDTALRIFENACSSPIAIEDVFDPAEWNYPVSKYLFDSLKLGSHNFAFMNKKTGDTCVYHIRVIDESPPTILYPGDTVILVKSDSLVPPYNYEFPVASDNCGVPAIIQTNGLPTGSRFPIGETTNEFKSIDQSGNFSVCRFKVTVIDTSSSSHQSLFEPSVFLPYLTDSVRYQQAIETGSCMLTAIMYDDSQPDQDSISIFLNGKEIVSREVINSKEVSPIVRPLLLDSKDSSTFIVKAWNQGKISPNTLRIDFYYGYHIDDIKKTMRKRPDFSRIFHCKPGLAGGVDLKCKQKK